MGAGTACGCATWWATTGAGETTRAATGCGWAATGWAATGWAATGWAATGWGATIGIPEIGVGSKPGGSGAGLADTGCNGVRPRRRGGSTGSRTGRSDATAGALMAGALRFAGAAGAATRSATVAMRALQAASHALTAAMAWRTVS